ncbi:MAG: SpoIIIAH-like family protein [Oscillospiraceae bacterium]|nr:SpoIIIAH-like family protein [Oscillospiraceae bacterium]
MKEWRIRPRTKRGILIAAVLVFVGASAWLNWSYNQRWGEGSTAMTQAEDDLTATVNAMLGTQTESGNSALTAQVSDYFAKARLTRQQSRDQALSLLETAASAGSASQEVIDSAMNDISVMANWSLLESKIESELLAKNFADCVVYLTENACTVAIPAPMEGQEEACIAQVTDAVLSNTDYTAAQINVIEVMNG